jgi:hypothetical protein
VGVTVQNNFVGATDPVLTGSYALKEFTYFTAIANEAGLPLGMTGGWVGGCVSPPGC